MRNDQCEEKIYRELRKNFSHSKNSGSQFGRSLDSSFDVFSTVFEIFICAGEFGRGRNLNLLEIIELYSQKEFNDFCMGCLHIPLNNWKLLYRDREVVTQKIKLVLSAFYYSPVHPELRQRIEGFRDSSGFTRICNYFDYHYQQDNLEERPLQTEILRYPVCCRNKELRCQLTNQIQTDLRNGSYSSRLPADKFDESYRYFTSSGHGVSNSDILRDLHGDMPGDSPITQRLRAQINSGFFSQKTMLDTIVPDPKRQGTAEFYDFFDLNERYNPWRVITLLMTIAGRNQQSYFEERLISVFDYYNDRPIKSIRWLRDFYEHLTIGLCTSWLC